MKKIPIKLKNTPALRSYNEALQRGDIKRCQNCNKKRKLFVWVGEGSTMDWVHGNYQMWCEECSLKAQLKHAKKLAKKIPVLEKKLSKIKEIGG